jgi:hypothetical protein
MCCVAGDAVSVTRAYTNPHARTRARVRARTHTLCPGEGKPKVKDEKDTTVYKRSMDAYSLKIKASRAVYTEVRVICRARTLALGFRVWAYT